MEGRVGKLTEAVVKFTCVEASAEVHFPRPLVCEGLLQVALRGICLQQIVNTRRSLAAEAILEPKGSEADG